MYLSGVGKADFLNTSETGDKLPIFEQIHALSATEDENKSFKEKTKNAQSQLVWAWARKPWRLRR